MAYSVSISFGSYYEWLPLPYYRKVDAKLWMTWTLKRRLFHLSIKRKKVCLQGRKNIVT